MSLPSKAGVLSAVTSAQLLQHHSPPPPPYFFPPLRFTGRVFSLVHGLHWAPKKKKTSRGGINKNVLAVTRDLSAGNEGPGGRRQRGENACSGVELDISVSCQRLVHGCGMLMSEVSLFFSPSLFLCPLPPVRPPPSPSLALSGRRKKNGSIADPMVLANALFIWPGNDIISLERYIQQTSS